MTTYIPHLTLPSAIFTSAPASILLPIVLGTAVGYSTRPKDAPSTPEKYLSLKQPPLRPPPWVFGPVWTVLYGLMGYASHRAFCNGTSPLLGNPSAVAAAAARHGATLYTVQLGLNLAWMPLFFGLGRPVAATLDVLALLGINAYLAYEWATAVTASPATSWSPTSPGWASPPTCRPARDT